MMEICNNYCVYIHRNIINNKAYIGITAYGDDPNRRWQNGNGYIQQRLFWNAIQKYGWDNFEHIIWSKNLTENEAKAWEIRLIALFNTTNSNYGYNISPGGESFNITDVGVIKRTNSMLETKNKNRIQKSIELFKDKFDNGDENILQCQKCGAYFEKETNMLQRDKKDASKKPKHRKKRKYCDYCSIYHKHTKRVVVCIDCGQEFIVTSKDTKTCRCQECNKKYNKTQKIAIGRNGENNVDNTK